MRTLKNKKKNKVKLNMSNKKRYILKWIFLTIIVFILLFSITMIIDFVVTTEKSKMNKTEIVSLEKSYEDISSSNELYEVLYIDEISETNEKETINYSEDDVFYLAAAVCREAGGESEEIQLLVANVIINRVNSSLYPNTIYEVLTQKSQYGTMWKNGISFPKWANQKDKEHCYEIAKRILDGERVCPDNVLFQAEFEQGTGIYKQFGNDYYFCYY